MSSRASLPLPPFACVPLLPLSPVAPSWFHPGVSLSLPDSSPSSQVIYLALVQNSDYPSRFNFRYPPYLSLPPQRFRLYRLYTFLFFASLYHYLSSAYRSLCIPTFFSAISLSWNSLASNCLPCFFISLSLPF